MISLRKLAGWGALLLMIALFATPRAQAACVLGGCVMAGPRELSLSTNESALLSPLMGSLLGSSVNVTAADWQQLAGADIKVADFANALNAQTNAGSPNAAITGNATIAQVLSAAATAATASGNAPLATVITNAAGTLAVPSQQIALGNVFKTTGNVGDSKINVLDLVTGTVEAWNYQYGVNTPTPVSVGTPSALGVPSATVVTIQARVVEPPVYFCGPTAASAQFHTAAIRLKLNITIPQPTQVTGLLNIPGVVTASNLTVLPNFSVYVDAARADGYISALDQSAGTMSVRITPGVVGLYLGSITDANFFTRTNGITAASFGYTDIANTGITLLGIGLINGTVQMKAAATGTAPVQETLLFTGPYPQTKTTISSVNSVGNLVTSLLGNLQLNANINLLGLVNLSVLTANALQPIKDVISTPITSVLTNVADPLLQSLGIKIGQAVVTAYGVFNLCTVSGYCYSDANHSGVKDVAEAGTSQTLYAKLVATAAPTTVYASTTVDGTSGAFSFTNVQAQGVSGTGYTLIIDTNATANDVTATAPTGWIAIEPPTMSRSITLSTVDITNQMYGLYNGSSLAGRVFIDTGVGSGTANNGVRDGTELPLEGARVTITNNAGSTTYDSAVTANDGVYLLYIPAAAGAASLKVTEANPASFVSTGGSAGNTAGAYVRATDTTTFTNVIGTIYTGVNFADVPVTSFATDGRQIVLPGNAAFFGHQFIAGTAGSVTFSSTAPSMAGWSHAIYTDTNCNGAVDTGETLVSAPLAVIAAQKVCLVVRVFAATTAAYNDEYPVSLSASFAYSNSAIVDALARNDLTLIGTANGAGLHLVKSVDKATASPGEVLTYTITYKNQSTGTLSSVKIYDSTPAYTVYTSGACGTLATGLSACALTTQPTVGQPGNLMWTMTGALASGASGTVTFAVTVTP